MNFDAIYPGMLDSSKEYFEAEGNVFLITNGMVQWFDDIQYHEELELIIETETKLKQTLKKMVGSNRRDQQKQLAKCRFGGLNFSADFSDDSKSTNDYRNCQLFCIPKILKNESNSQPDNYYAIDGRSCFVSQRYWKMKAIHNTLR